MPHCSLRRLLWVGPVATLAAFLVNLMYYGLTKALGEQYLMPLEGSNSLSSPMPVSMLGLVILIPGLLATIFFGLLVRFTRRPATVFLSVSLAALLLSLGGPVNLPAASMQTKILLGGMHIIAAAVITGGILLMRNNEAK
jgi:ABC-type transport system involved in cytochrome c biogenesis permease subunit